MRIEVKAKLKCLAKLKHFRSYAKRAISILLTIAFLLTNIFPVFSLFTPQKAYAAANVPLSLKFDNFNDTSLLQLNGNSTTASYNGSSVLRVTPAAVNMKGSTYTKKRISLANDRSFSTYFEFIISGASGPYGPGEGFTFTLQTVGSTTCGVLNAPMASDGTAPSVSIEFDTYGNGGTSHIGINTNGSSTSLAQVNTSSNIWDGNEYYVWIDYDGLSNQMEVRINQNSSTRPASAQLTKTGLDLAAILNSDEVYAGFTAASGQAYENNDILTWYFNNDYSPIDVANNTYIDASQLALTALPASNTNSSTITASLTDMSGSPVSGVPVSFTTDLGTLSQSVVTSDASGQAVVTLDAGSSTGTAAVKAVALGGAYGTVNVGLVSQTDTQAVAADKTALEIGYGAGDAASSVTQNVTLVTSGANGSSISWSSNSTGVITNTGTVNRPAYGSGDATVTLTATISKGSATDTMVFTLVVKEQAQTDAQAVAADKAALDVVYGAGDSASNVTQNVSLATGGASGTSISWSSNNTGVITNSGTVNRPSYLAGDASVTLTATISKGSASDTKVFNLTVKALSMSDTEAVAADKTALNLIFGGTDTAGSVTQSLGALTTSGANGTTITWASSNTSILSNDGQAVNRPSYTEGDAAVTLTATISKVQPVILRHFLLPSKPCQ